MGRTRRTSRPDYSWTNFGDVNINNDLGTVVGQFGTTASFVVGPQTLIRTRGRVSVTLDAGAVDEKATILCGLTKVSQDLFVAAAGSAPEILTLASDEASWIWQGSLYVTSGAEAAIVSDFLSASLEVDTKAMRKLKPGDAIAFVFQSPAELVVDQGGTFDISYWFHCLNQT